MKLRRVTPAERRVFPAILMLAAAFAPLSAQSQDNATSTARALVAADIDGQGGHGLSRLPAYAAQVKAGKIDGKAVPSFARTQSVSVLDPG